MLDSGTHPEPRPQTGSNERSLRPLLQGIAVLGLGIGCWMVLRPFVSAILFAVVICVATWPAYLRLSTRFDGRAGLASAALCLLVCCVLLLPAAFIVVASVEGFHWVLSVLEQWNAAGAKEPGWVLRWSITHLAWQYFVPATGESLMASLLAQYADPTRAAIVAGSRLLISAATQSAMTIILLFFMYRFGSELGTTVQRFVVALDGRDGFELLSRAQQTIVAVAIGTIGAGLFQATVAGIGFVFAGVPHPLLFAALTFVVSMLPFGPPMIWAGVATWLFWRMGPGWGLFMLVYGGLAISSIDNVVKPLLISRTAHVPFLVTFLGILGGLSAFGMAGLFIGPVLLAIAVELCRHHRSHCDQHGDPSVRHGARLSEQGGKMQSVSVLPGK